MTIGVPGGTSDLRRVSFIVARAFGYAVTSFRLSTGALSTGCFAVAAMPAVQKEDRRSTAAEREHGCGKRARGKESD